MNLKKNHLYDWIDGQEVMQTLKISPRTLQRFRDNGTFPHSHAGRKIYYRASDIERILNDNYVSFSLKNKVK